jgi:hypothetical protein
LLWIAGAALQFGLDRLEEGKGERRPSARAIDRQKAFRAGRGQSVLDRKRALIALLHDLGNRQSRPANSRNFSLFFYNTARPRSSSDAPQMSSRVPWRLAVLAFKLEPAIPARQRRFSSLKQRGDYATFKFQPLPRRHAALKMQINKTDQNDAEGLAQMFALAGTGPFTSSRSKATERVLFWAQGLNSPV